MITKNLKLDVSLLILSCLLIIVTNRVAPSILSNGYTQCLFAALLLVQIINIILETLWPKKP